MAMATFWTLMLLQLVSVITCPLPSPTVSTKNGKLRGAYMKSRNGRLYESYLAIPYAEPPVGKYRFESARPAKPWNGVRPADKMPPACMQTKPSVGNTSEDCLYLNVFTPAIRLGSKLPVMAWIYGGSFEVNAISTFTAECLLDEFIVLVCIQYRLGLFGFLSTGDHVMPGNQGVKDQRLGLRWVQDNILQFGGDPKKVTIFGQSAGAMCVHALMLFSSNEGIFRAGITQSGVSLLTVAFHPPNEVEMMVQSLASISKCPNNSTGLVNCLKEKPAEFILSLLSQYQDSRPVSKILRGLPPLGLVLEADCVPDRIVTRNPWEVTHNVPWLTGVLDREVLEFVAPLAADRTNTLFTMLETNFDLVLPLALGYEYSSVNGSGVPAATRAFYLDNQPISRNTFSQLVELLTDAIFTYGIYEAVLRSNVKNTYVYMFEYIGANHNYITLPPNETVGAAHEDDVYFFFPHPQNITNTRIYSNKDDEFSRKLVKLWANFATHLNPTPSQGIQWKPFGKDQYFYNFGQSLITLNKTFLPERMNFWNNQPFVYRDDSIGPIKC